MKQIFTLLIALCWLLPSAHADVRRTEAKDSLLRIYLASPADTTRLETLYQIALLDQLSPTFIYYENKLLEEAITQKNILYQSAAIYAHIIYYYNLFSLADIAMYTDDAEVPLYDVLESIKEKEKSAQASIDPKKATPEQLREYLAEVLPNFDRERVYVADIKKLVAWYNILISNGITEFKPEGEIKEEEVAE